MPGGRHYPKELPHRHHERPASERGTKERSRGGALLCIATPVSHRVCVCVCVRDCFLGKSACCSLRRTIGSFVGTSWRGTLKTDSGPRAEGVGREKGKEHQAWPQGGRPSLKVGQWLF